MSGNDSLDGPRRAQEEGYFRKEQQELIEKLRKKAELAAERKSMGETLGIADEELIAELIGIGFTRATLALLHLTPLVQMAWADGSVSKAERKAITDAARSRGIEAGDEADKQLADWLDVRPTDEFFGKTIRAIRAFVSALPASERHVGAMSIVDCIEAVARVSGGILGLGWKISEKEQALLEQVAAELVRDHKSAAEALEKKLG